MFNFFLTFYCHAFCILKHKSSVWTPLDGLFCKEIQADEVNEHYRKDLCIWDKLRAFLSNSSSLHVVSVNKINLVHTLFFGWEDSHGDKEVCERKDIVRARRILTNKHTLFPSSHVQSMHFCYKSHSVHSKEMSFSLPEKMDSLLKK